VTVFEENLLQESFKLAGQLREYGIRTACISEPEKLMKQFKYADRIGVPIVIVMGPDEILNGKVTVKDLRSRTQNLVERSELAMYLKNLLAEESAV